MHLRHILLVDHSLKITKKTKKRREKETGDSRSIYQNKLDKVFFNMIWLVEILKN